MDNLKRWELTIWKEEGWQLGGGLTVLNEGVCQFRERWIDSLLNRRLTFSRDENWLFGLKRLKNENWQTERSKTANLKGRGLTSWRDEDWQLETKKTIWKEEDWHFEGRKTDSLKRGEPTIWREVDCPWKDINKGAGLSIKMIVYKNNCL